MAIEYTIVDNINQVGRVLSSGTTDNPARMGYKIDAPTVLRPEIKVIVGQGMRDDDVWWNGTAFVLRPSLDATNKFTNENDWVADGVDEITYGPNLPNPTKVTIACDSYLFIPIAPVTVTDGQLEMTATLKGTYKLTLEAFPYLDKVIEVKAN